MKQLRSTVLVTSVALLSAAALAACSSQTPQAGETSGGGSGESAGEVVTITYATPATQDVYEAGEKPVIEAFQAANPDIKVEVDLSTLDNYNTKLTTAFRGGQGPDLGRVNHTDIQTFAAGGYLAPLDDLIAANDIDVDALIPGLVEAGQYDGQQVTLPLTTDTRVLFYNPKLLAEHGITEPPETWDELLDAVAAFAGTDVYGYAFSTDSDYALAYESVGPYMVGAGGAILAPDGDSAKAVASESEGTVAAFELVQDIVATGAVPPGLDNFTGDQLCQLFAQEKLAFFIGGPWMRTTVLANNPDLAYGTDFLTTPVPVREAGQQSGSTAGGWQIGVFANSQHQEAAGRLLAYLMQPDVLTQLNANEAFPPLNSGLTSEPYASDDFYGSYSEQLAGAALPILPVQRMAEVSAALENTLEPYLVDPTKPVTEGLKAFDDQVNDSILE